MSYLSLLCRENTEKVALFVIDDDVLVFIFKKVLVKVHVADHLHPFWIESFPEYVSYLEISRIRIKVNHEVHVLRILGEPVVTYAISHDVAFIYLTAMNIEQAGGLTERFRDDRMAVDGGTGYLLHQIQLFFVPVEIWYRIAVTPVCPAADLEVIETDAAEFNCSHAF